MTNLSFKHGELSNLNSVENNSGTIYFAKDTDTSHSTHGYLFYDDDNRIPINGAGYYIAPDTKDNTKKNIFIENSLFNIKHGAILGVGCDDYEIWLHKSSNTTSSNRGLWSPLIKDGEDVGSWILRIGGDNTNGHYTYLGSPSYYNDENTKVNTYGIRPMLNNKYSFGDTDFVWATAHINKIYGQHLGDPLNTLTAIYSKFIYANDLQVMNTIVGTAEKATMLTPGRNIQVGTSGTKQYFDGTSDIVLPLSISASWTQGTSAGPKLKITINGDSKEVTLPSASEEQSGIVTKGSQVFAGDKTFQNNTTYFRMTSKDKWGSISPTDEAYWSTESVDTTATRPGVCITAHYYGQSTSTSTVQDWHVMAIDRVVLSAGNNSAFYPTSIDKNGGYVNRITLGHPDRRWTNIYGQNLNINNSTDSNIKLYWSSSSNLRIGSAAAVVPNRNNAITCGSDSYKWKEVFAATAEINDSDIRLKEIQSQEHLNKLIKVYNSLTPIAYKFKNVTEQDNYKRIHVGFSAQEVEEKMLENNLTRLDFAGLCIDPVYQKDEEGENTDIQIDEHYGLRYGEFHGLHMLKNHQQDARITELESKNRQLENTILELKTQIELIKLAIGR